LSQGCTSRAEIRSLFLPQKGSRRQVPNDGDSRKHVHEPASYFPSIEKKYGRSIAEWQKIIDDCGLDKHTAIVRYLKSDYGMGHGHANALVGWTLAGNTATP
jgi:hypothetical protein